MSPARTRATPARTGRRMDLRRIGRAGDAIIAARRAEDDALDAVVEELVEAGDCANITLAAKLAGVTRSTLYARLKRRQETT